MCLCLLCLLAGFQGYSSFSGKPNRQVGMRPGTLRARDILSDMVFAANIGKPLVAADDSRAQSCKLHPGPGVRSVSKSGLPIFGAGHSAWSVHGEQPSVLWVVPRDQTQGVETVLRLHWS